MEWAHSQMDLIIPHNIRIRSLVLIILVGPITTSPNGYDDSYYPGGDTGSTTIVKDQSRFRVGTNEMAFENWGVSAEIEVSGYSERHPLRYRMEAISPRSYQDMQFTTNSGEFKLGQLQQDYQYDSAIMPSNEDHHAGAPNLWDRFRP